jgi:hypothetical protein
MPQFRPRHSNGLHTKPWLTVMILATSLLELIAHSPVHANEIARLTEADCREFSNKWIATIQSGDLGKCSRLYDTDTFVEAMLGPLTFHYDDRADVLRRWKRGIRESHALYAPIVASVAEGGALQILSVNPRTDDRHVVARWISVDGSLDYVLLSLGRNAEDEIFIVDVQGAVSGGSVRDTLQSTVAHFAPYDGPNGKIAGEAPNAEQLILDKRVLAGMNGYLKDGKGNEVLALYERLSSGIRQERYPLFMALTAAISLYGKAKEDGSKEIATSFEKTVVELARSYRTLYPNDATVDMMLIDYFVQGDQIEAANRSIDSIDNWIGGDPYLDTLRAQLLLIQGESGAARAAAERSLRNGSEVFWTYEVLALVAEQQGDSKRAAELRDAATKKFGANLVKGIDASKKQQ